MTDTKQLETTIKGSGIKYQFVAEQLGITRFGLRKKMKNESEFKASEIDTLCKLLKISTLEKKEQIFFASKVI